MNGLSRGSEGIPSIGGIGGGVAGIVPEQSTGGSGGKAAPEAQPQGPLVALPDGVIPLVPMRNAVLFPHVLMPISVGRPKSVAAVRFAMHTEMPLGIVLQRDPSAQDPAAGDVFEMGTLAQVLRPLASQDNQQHVLCQGLHRFRILEWVEGHPFLAARVEAVEEPQPLSTRAEALGLQLRERGAEILSLLPGVPADVAQALQAIRSPAQLADVTASLLDTDTAKKQQLLEMLDTEERLKNVLELLNHHIDVLRLSREIGARTQESISTRDRKYLLREQLKTIQKELGESPEDESDTAALEDAIDRAGMPEDTAAYAHKELRRLQRMGPAGSEHALLNTWLEWLTELPWKLPEPAPIDLEASRAILESDHFGLERVKQRVIEYLAVRKLNPKGRAPILCFVGPPGVGKTSLGQSIARALQRPFVRVSLGGVHDEAEMRGHRRTYVGAMPGRIIAALRKAGSRHCVMMLDEVDKLNASHQGDPSAALLEILDPEQNHTFRDNYLGVPFDLSAVVFIATANVIDAVSAPVRDRMETIDIAGYTQEEKLQIALRYLLGRQREASGLIQAQCEIEIPALKTVIDRYTREAGVRQLEREIGRLMRHAATQVAQNASTQLTIAQPDLESILGPAPYEHEAALRTSVPGVATGLAWTPVGGDILFIEATRIPGKGQLILTGQLGDVMKESAQAALTLLKSRAADLNFSSALFETSDIHLHVPAGAIPKDGPSAGVAMFVAVASLFTGRAVRYDVAMTGEISLRGLVLPVGGIKEKVLAAQRAGVRCVLLPARNRKDLRDIPASTQAALRFVWLEHVDDALQEALNGPPLQLPGLTPAGSPVVQTPAGNPVPAMATPGTPTAPGAAGDGPARPVASPSDRPPVRPE
jgi:ATP-dependent Lon protease